jgi:hypothetical protein
MQKVHVNIYLKGGKMLSGLMEQTEMDETGKPIVPQFIGLERPGFFGTVIPIDSLLYLDIIGMAS